MNYDRIILELLDRVQALEQQVADIRTELGHDAENKSAAPRDLGEVTRSEARERAISAIRDRFPDYLVDRASRLEGSGIKIIKDHPGFEGAVFLKFYHSKTYVHPVRGEHAWHTVNIDDVVGTTFDFVLFSVLDSQGRWNFLIFKPSELLIYKEEHRSSGSDLLHLYFTFRDGKALEIRESTVDVTNYLNNWDVLK